MVRIIYFVYAVLLVGLLQSRFARSEILNGNAENAGDALSLKKRSEILYENNLSKAGVAGGAADDLSLEKRSPQRPKKGKAYKGQGNKEYGK
uniref:Uncharacterized protein n=1 Tax=Octopus bimaculoides TaxID=37653 RepID=A0A0L8IGD8_OCTBM